MTIVDRWQPNRRAWGAALPHATAVALFAVLMLVTIGWVVGAQRAHGQESQEAVLRHQAMTTAQRVGDLLDGVDAVLRAVAARHRDAGTTGKPDDGSLVASLAAAFEEVDALYVIGAEGEILHGSRPWTGFQGGDAVRFAKADADGNPLVITGPHPLPGSQTPGLTLSRRMVSADGRFGGVVLAHVGVAAIGRRLVPGDADPGTLVRLRTLEGAPVAQHPASIALDRGPYAAAADEAERVIAEQRLDRYPLQVGIERMTAAGASAWPRETAVLWALWAGLVVAAGVVARRLHAAARSTAEATRTVEPTGAARSVFLSTLGHELRTPLNVVTGYAELLSRSNLERVQDSHLRHIRAAAGRMQEIVGNVLDLSRLEAGELSLIESDFSLQQVVDDVQAAVREEAVRKGITVHAEVRGVREALHGDARRLQQCLRHLVDNAVRFTEHGSVTVTVRGEAVRGQIRLRFEVRDTGVGIPPERQAELIRPVSAPARVGTAPGGRRAGLGLQITPALVHRMGGDMGFESRPGEGSLFWFTVLLRWAHHALPDTAEPPVRERADRDLRRRYRGTRVLVAEDDAVSQGLARTLLGEAGIEVDVVADGRAAIERVTNQSYAAVLMDMGLPDVDGLAATRAIRALPRHHDVPIVMLTANGPSEAQQACVSAGANAFIAKPFDAETLFGTLRRVFDASTAVLANPGPDTDASGYPGLDLERGLRSWETAATLRTYLRLFASEYGGIAARIAAADPSARLQLTHKLKGAAINVGLVDVAFHAVRVHDAVRDGADAAHECAELAAALDVATASIKAYAASAETPSPAAPVE